VPANFCYETKKAKKTNNTGHASQLMTTDYLAFEVIKALRKTQMAESWIKDKEHEFKDMTRLQVLRSLSNLDNLQAVADQICVSIEDMQATLRVLKNLKWPPKDPC
jgi:predicted nucleic acid-binding protein